MERSNRTLCNITKKQNGILPWRRSVLKSMKEVSEQQEAIENDFADAYTECQKTQQPEQQKGKQGGKTKDSDGCDVF